MNPIESAKEWLLSIALKKGAAKGVTALASFLAAKSLLLIPGVCVQLAPGLCDPAILGAAIMSGLEVLRNYLKQKYSGKLGWLP